MSLNLRLTLIYQIVNRYTRERMTVFLMQRKDFSALGKPGGVRGVLLIKARTQPEADRTLCSAVYLYGGILGVDIIDDPLAVGLDCVKTIFFVCPLRLTISNLTGASLFY